MTLKSVQRAIPSLTLREVKRYRMEFVFDGRDYKPAQASVEPARLFSPR